MKEHLEFVERGCTFEQTGQKRGQGPVSVVVRRGGAAKARCLMPPPERTARKRMSGGSFTNSIFHSMSFRDRRAALELIAGEGGTKQESEDAAKLIDHQPRHPRDRRSGRQHKRTCSSTTRSGASGGLSSIPATGCPAARFSCRPQRSGAPDPGRPVYPVGLTRESVKNAPGVEMDKPVSRQLEADIYSHYAWNPYWVAGYGYPDWHCGNGRHRLRPPTYLPPALLAGDRAKDRDRRGPSRKATRICAACAR